jgi:ABC-type Zn2+ transport system substrate-binding protein/surface adhesin
MKACREGRKEAVKMLIEHGAQVDIINYEQMTARETAREVDIDDIIRQCQGSTERDHEHHLHENMRDHEHIHKRDDMCARKNKISSNRPKKTAGASG